MLIVIRKKFPDRVAATHDDAQLAEVQRAYDPDIYEIRRTADVIVDIPLPGAPVQIPADAVPIAVDAPSYDDLAAKVIDLELRLKAVETGTPSQTAESP